MRGIFFPNTSGMTAKEELSEGECVLSNILAAAVSCGTPCVCVWTLAQPQTCPFREGRAQSQRQAELFSRSQRLISQGQATNSTKMSMA